MKGKIFAESSNIHQDQARILFGFYQSAAERIVQEEERIEREIEQREAEKESLEAKLSSFWRRVFLWFQGKLKKTRMEVESLAERITELHKNHSEIFRDYTVSKLGVAYVPIADQIKYENRSFVVDHTGSVGESVVKLQLSRQNELLIQTISELEGLTSQAPIVEGSNAIEGIETGRYSASMQQLNQHDYLARFERSLRTISFCMDDLDVTSVQLPLVASGSPYLNFLKEFATNSPGSDAHVFEAFDTRRYDEEISKFQQLNKLKDSLSRHTTQFEDVLKGLMMSVANSVQAISALKVASADRVIQESNKVLYRILKSPYNHYSPVLEAPEIERIRNESFNYSEAVNDYVPFQLKESSKVRYNLVSGTWIAEDGSTTNTPFGIHQIHEEIVAPIVQNLMNETRIERLKIYNHIKDQKISYLNKWHQDTEDFYGRNRAESADLINLMRASLRDYVAAFNTLSSLKRTEDSMSQSDGSLDSTVVSSSENSADVLAEFEMQSTEFQDLQLDFENYMELLKEDIDVKAKKFEHIDYYDALLRDSTPREIAVATDEVHGMDARRKPLVTVNPWFAKTSELPPAPSVAAITSEHMALDLPGVARTSLRELEIEPASDVDKVELDVAVLSPLRSIEEHPSTGSDDGDSGAGDDEEESAESVVEGEEDAEDGTLSMGRDVDAGTDMDEEDYSEELADEDAIEDDSDFEEEDEDPGK